MKFRSLIFGLLLTSSLSSFAQNGRNNLDLLGQLSYNFELSDVWGYVDGSGREYALVGVQNGVSIVDLDTTPILERHFIPGAFSTWRDLKTYQDHAYVSNESGNGLLVIDLSGLPGSIDFKDTVIAGMQTIHNLWVDDKEGKLYIVGANQFNGGMAILDLTNDPWLPAIEGNYNNAYVHDVYVRDGLAYSAELSNGLTIVNVNTPSFAYVIGNQGYSGNFTHNTWLNDAGTVCFTTDETSAAYIQAWDITDPGNIQFLDRIRSEYSNGVTIPHNAHVQDDFIVVSYYTDGVIVYDGSHPEALVEVAYYDTSPFTGSGFSGAWGAYPFLPSGRILVSDIEEGLFVLQPAYDRAAFVLGMVTDSMTGMPIEGVEINLVTTPETDFSNLDGSYVFGQADSGTYPITFEKYGYESKTFVVNFVPGQETVLDVELNPLTRLSLEVLVKDSRNQLPVEGAIVQAIAPANQVTFDFTTDLDGRVIDPNFVANPYTIRVGKWGFVSQEIPFTLDVGSQTLTVLLDSGYYDDFAFDFGWQVEGNARTGIWERADPIGTFQNLNIYAPSFDIFGDIGDQAFVTGNGGGTIGFDDVDDGTTTLISPPMDLSTYNDPLLTYHWWLVNQSSNGNDGDDWLRVEIDNGSTSLPIRFYPNTGNNFWSEEDSIRLSDFLPTDTVFTIRFVTRDEGNPNIVEAAIDGFQILEGDPDEPDPIDTTTTSIAPLLSRRAIVVHPQPLQNHLNISYDLPVEGNHSWSYSIFNVQGQELVSRRFSGLEGEEGLAFPYSSGVYFLHIFRDQKLVEARKLLK